MLDGFLEMIVAGGAAMGVVSSVLLYLALINIFGFFQMWLDKRKAQHHAWRISERQLFLVAMIGGSAGSILGMYVFRHKTKHWYFVWGMPAILVAQLLIAIVVGVNSI